MKNRSPTLYASCRWPKQLALCKCVRAKTSSNENSIRSIEESCIVCTGCARRVCSGYPVVHPLGSTVLPCCAYRLQCVVSTPKNLSRSHAQGPESNSMRPEDWRPPPPSRVPGSWRTLGFRRSTSPTDLAQRRACRRSPSRCSFASKSISM